jgi:glycosyltransferase involved in cell wall biosynthesis
MNILYLHQYFVTPEGAGAIRSYEFARSLIERGHMVTMVCGSHTSGKTGLSGPYEKGRRRGNVDGIDVIEFNRSCSNSDSLPKRALAFMSFAWRSASVALCQDYDLVFATSTPLTVGIPGVVANRLKRKKLIFEVRDLWPELPREMGVVTNPFVLKAMDILEWLSYHSATKCIGLSPGIVEGIKRRGIEADHIAMIPNGCDLDIFTPNSGPRERPEGFAEDDFIGVFAGAHGIANGLDAVLDAATELKKRNRKDLKFLMVGTGRLKPDLMTRAQNEGLDNCIFWDTISKQQLASLFHQVDVGLMILANVPAFYYGTSPNKFFDYIAAGLPVLNNYPGWLADMIKENECGGVVAPDNPIAFADTMESMAADREQLKAMGLNARKLAEREFARTLLADKFVNWVENTVRQ